MRTFKQLMRNNEDGKHLLELEDYYVKFYMENLEETIDKKLDTIPYFDLRDRKDIVLNLPQLHVDQLVHAVPQPVGLNLKYEGEHVQDFGVRFRPNTGVDTKLHPLAAYMSDHTQEEFDLPENTHKKYYEYLYLLNAELDVYRITNKITEQLRELIHQYQENDVPISKYVIGFYSATGDEE